MPKSTLRFAARLSCTICIAIFFSFRAHHAFADSVNFQNIPCDQVPKKLQVTFDGEVMPSGSKTVCSLNSTLQTDQCHYVFAAKWILNQNNRLLVDSNISGMSDASRCSPSAIIPFDKKWIIAHLSISENREGLSNNSNWGDEVSFTNNNIHLIKVDENLRHCWAYWTDPQQFGQGFLYPTDGIVCGAKGGAKGGAPFSMNEAIATLAKLKIFDRPVARFDGPATATALPKRTVTASDSHVPSSAATN